MADDVRRTGTVLREALAKVPTGARQVEKHSAVRAWSARLERLAASTQRDPYLHKAPEILTDGVTLARELGATPGYAAVALTVCGVLVGLQGGMATPELALVANDAAAALEGAHG